jgi:rubrerythrin
MAVGAEMNSVVFYTGLKELVPSELARDRVETIIKEEMGHLVILKLKLAELG